MMIKGSVLFVFGILMFLGNALTNFTDIFLGKKTTPTMVQTAKERNIAKAR